MIDTFLNHSRSIKGQSEKTILNYGSDLRQFVNFICKQKDLTEDKIDYNQITLTDIYDFISYRTKEGDCASTRARRIATIKSYFKYLKKMNIINFNISVDLESPKIPKRIPKSLNLKESFKLLNVVDGDNKARDFAILNVFLHCGLRLSELRAINVEDIKGDILTVIGKGDKQRQIPLNEDVIDAIKQYVKIRKPKNNNDNALFISEFGTRMCISTIQKTVKKYMKQIGIDKNFSTHSLRHTTATLLYNEGAVDIRTLQEILGHTNIATTQIYAEVNHETMRNAMKKNPLNTKKS